jgi:hypothetical protein
MTNCIHTRSIPTGELIRPNIERYKHGFYEERKCLDCKAVFCIFVPKDDPLSCTHPNGIPIREEMRTTQCGKLVPTKIWRCPDCGREFSVR